MKFRIEFTEFRIENTIFFYMYQILHLIELNYFRENTVVPRYSGSQGTQASIHYNEVLQ